MSTKHSRKMHAVLLAKIEENTASLGTRWVAPGEGATIASLLDAVYGPHLRDAFRKLNTAESVAVAHISDLETSDRRTNLALTGAPLTAADLERIARATVPR